MRVVAAVALVVATWMPVAASADPVSLTASEAAALAASVDRFHVGADTAWSPSRFDERVSLGLGWRVPRRWYDADGVLLTERSLLHPGRDLERPGLYFAFRF
jgi:hypothetical protein